MRARIKDKKEIAKNTLQIDFEMMDHDLEFESGQYLSITLLDMPYSDSRGSIRYFSICTSPSQFMEFSIATRLSSSAYKRSLLRMSFGRQVELGSINGQLVLPRDKTKHLVMIAGGIGITPFMSMIRCLHENFANKHWSQEVTLIYVNKNEESTAWLSELKTYAQKVKNFKLHLVMTDQADWTGDDRHIDNLMIKEQIEDYKQAYYLVTGPNSMVMAVADNFDKLGLKPEQYVLESFVGY